MKTGHWPGDNCLKVVRNAKSNFIKDELNTHFNDPKKFWDKVSLALPSNSSGSNLIKLKNHNNIVISEEDTSDYINNFFSNIGKNLASKLSTPWTYKGTECDVQMNNYQVELDEVITLIKNIDISKSSSVDYLSSNNLKDAFTVIPNLLKILFNVSLSSGLVPNTWKKAKVIPLKKCGSGTDVNNLRPISLLPLPGKLLEKVVHNRLAKHLNDNNLLDTRQGGFRSNHSTVDTISNFTEELYQGINDGEITVATFIDLKKAFDTVNHKILLQKLNKLGINGANLAWVDNYLSDRCQATLANGVLSNTKTVNCGVPQGSVLGPLLFLVYVNDIGNIFNFSNHYLYADDTVIFRSGLNIDEIVNELQRDLCDFGTWCKSNKLTINTKKSNFVIYGTNQKINRIGNCKLSLQNDQLTRSQSYKYLGVFLDSRLNFNTHIDNCSKIVSHKLYILSKIRHFITENTSTRIYKSMIALLIDYGDIIYAGASDLRLQGLQKLQNRGLRICLNNQRYTLRIQLHQSCSVLPLKIRRKYNLRKYMFKQKSNPRLVIDRDIRTRRHDAVVFETCIPKLELYKKGSIYRGVQVWNVLPAVIRNIDTFTTFKAVQKNEMYDYLPLVTGSDF